jgi:hypothetical protein
MTRILSGVAGLLAVGLALTSCAPKHVDPVKVMVPVPCVTTKPVRPSYPTVRADAGLFERVQQLLAERELRRAYEGELEATLSACD